ncbi:MAG: substrate-binding domain-containing protein [Granulosicoccus sp.]
MQVNDTSPVLQKPTAVDAKRVGIVTSSFASPYYGVLVEAASSYLSCRGFSVLVQSRLQSHKGKLDAYKALVESECDGLIIHADTMKDDELNLVMQKHPNFVLVNHHLPQFSDRCVAVDNKLGGAIAARFFAALGHKKIAMVSGPSNYFEANDRALGFKRELAAHELELTVELFGDFSQDSGEAAMERLHAEYPGITAVFFHNDEMSCGALNACKRLGLLVPTDISIVGFDGLPMCEYLSPKLTSVQQPLRQLGEHAAKVICDLLLDTEPEERACGTTYLPVLAERESVSTPAGHETEKISLTQRETECLTWTARGKTSWEISVILGFSESTATFHLRNAGAKLKASNRANAVAIAIHLGLIEFKQE